MTDAIQDALVSMVMAGTVLIAAVLASRAIAHVRLHHPLARSRFRRRHHVERLPINRTIAQAPRLPLSLPTVPSQIPASTGNAPAMPAGPRHGRCSA